MNRRKFLQLLAVTGTTTFTNYGYAEEELKLENAIEKSYTELLNNIEDNKINFQTRFINSTNKNKVIKGFTSKYNIVKLVYYEEYEYVHDAIAREKQIKGGSREKKIALIESTNKEWKDLVG